MSFGHSGSLRFEVNKNSTAPGIFWQREKPKADQRKFGYKSKGLRHPIRRPDNEEALEELMRAQEEEKKKFNKNNQDFIKKNQQRYKQKSQDQGQSTGSTHITPGTVTLTQEQLAALLASLGSLKSTGDQENPLKISIDASNNKIGIEKYDSDSGDDVKINGHDKEDEEEQDDGGGGVGIYSLLDSGEVVKKSSKPNKKQKDTNLRLSREDDRRRTPEQPQNDPGPDTARSTLNETKREARVAHIPPTVPWKHMTVGERKRMQWAMEKAEVQQEYDPWGRPGAGAPMSKTETSEDKDSGAINKHRNNKEDTRSASREKLIRQRQQDDLQSEIQKLQEEIRQAEQRKRKEVERLQNEVDTKSKNKSRKEARDRKPVEDETDAKPKRRANRDTSGTRNTAVDKDENRNSDQVQIVIINKKRDKQKRKERDEDRSDDEEEKREDLDSSSKSNEASVAKSSQITAKEHESAQRSKGTTKEVGSRSDDQTMELKMKAKGSHFGEEDLSHLTKKEQDRRKWLAELDKQREEQRMKKQQEKERDRAGVQDQWADRFVYHKSPQDVTPRYGQTGLSPRNQVSVLGKAPEDSPVSLAPPAAMRSSMVVGTGTLNDARFDNKKAEEKRQWLEELEKQREEQRRIKAEKKARERQEDDGMWADHRQTDRQKLNQFAGTSSQGPSFMEQPKAVEYVDTHRTNSAPVPPLASVRASQEEPTTFLRGQGAYVDPVTRKEQEEKRRVHLEYQAQIKAQIEEKERLKREERERKIREDMEEERKLQMERDRFLKQEEAEQAKNKEREALRQKQMAVLKSAMDEAQEKAQEDKNVKRIQHLRQHGHDISQLKAAYEEPVSRMSGPGTHRPPANGGNSQATTPRIKEYDISNIPGLSGAPSPPPPQAAPQRQRGGGGHMTAEAQGGDYYPRHHSQGRGEARHPIGQSYTKEPYVEDRVLTPSRFRDPSRPRDEPDSPRREFGTQTLELKDLQAILKSLPDDIQIEYKMRVEEALKEKEKMKQPPSRKVHSKSAEDPQRTRKTAPRKEVPRERPTGKARPPRPNEKPAWNQTKRKTVIKNSEKDPFYQQKKEESEARKVKRERQLQYLQELNKERIPNISPTRARGSSPPETKARGPPAERGRKPADPNRTKKAGGRTESPNILSLLNDEKTSRSNRSRSPAAGRGGGRSSPPLPTVKHRTATREEDPNNPYSYTNSVLRVSEGDTRYGDLSVTTAPVHDGEFVPFMRTTEILDPAQADDPLAISRENSRMERARKAYHDTRHPANKGRKLDVYQDREREAALKAAAQNPILNPQLVTDHPTARQDMILQQLSSLKQNLMQRRKELENFMSPSELEGDQGNTLKT